MPVDPALLELMTQVFAWKVKTGQDRWQKPTYADPVDVIGYQVDGEHEVKDDNGVKRIAKGTIYLADVYGIRTQDDVEWCDESVGEIIRIENFNDENGPYGSVLHYG